MFQERNLVGIHFPTGHRLGTRLIADMLNSIKTHPVIYHEFMNGHFAVQKTSNVFSAIAIDQCHEQMNKLVKGEGGAVGLTEDPQALER